MFCHDADGISEPTFVVEIDRLLAGSSNQKLTVSASILGKMTAAERDVALALAAGHSNQEIADLLGKTVPAVKFLLHRIYEKTGSPNRTALVAALCSLPDGSK